VLVTNGGGLGVLATDAARAAGLEVTPLTPATRERLRGVIPAHASATNPVDLVGDATEPDASDRPSRVWSSTTSFDAMVGGTVVRTGARREVHLVRIGNPG
jgi:acyl-CoA synthetase (NDP forming)